jgi:hypothetical protein
MADWSIADYSTNPASNSEINGINIAEGCPASGINNAIRQMMADLAAGYFALAGTNVVTVPVGGASNTTLNATQNAANILEFTGNITGAKQVIFDGTPRFYFIRNKTTGTAALKMSPGGTGDKPVAPKGDFVLLCDGTDMWIGQSAVNSPPVGDSSSAIPPTSWVTAAINAAKTTLNSTITSSVATEKSRAIAKENSLQDQIDDEVSRATAAENANAAAISAETTHRTTAITNLQNQINAIPSHTGTGGVGDFVLNVQDTTTDYGVTRAGPFLGQATGTTWRSLGNIFSADKFATLWVRIS